MNSSFGLTPRQAEALLFIRGFTAERGYAPSFSEIADGIGIASKGRVHRLVHDLKDRGVIDMLPDRRRSIVVRETT